MFKKLVLFFFLCLPLSTFGATAPYTGGISAADLLAEYDNFAQQYKNFTPSKQDITLIQKLKGKELTVLFGTWCHDSAREVPRLIKLLEQSKVQLESIKFVAVGYNKQDASGVAQAHNLQYTPTIIVSQNGKELTRMVEKPAGTLAQDLTKNLP
ncbi:MULTISPECIES: thioredoxin family protein [Pseudoalteromonas]|jgi:thiol-disulfide isomerase/thioredoxin|uniref:TlpA family protein disulfide reductase n=1 Tax=Pseudoalteromonas TaxID=53246 RepID=UPI0015CDC57A|nr:MULTISPECIES: thioredoxin family protein [Pseudoalteromonas]MBB1372542.1 thioredoxin family protein [Pseudoalteromonas sp. SR45-4]MBH0092204.1 thioredoxin family protein [Pseudoalteromonas sp. SCQQ13]NYR13183.1 thioredoxin family protein [Pseudoalteromonas sp. MIP2626]WMS96212.1 thioredoxin family protein [Pseudoalteromonas sp. HL-AS2]|tara:strand:- start:2172 stop:2633 length:462 start_codon:yes stop_codon:yes gene_type:complete